MPTSGSIAGTPEIAAPAETNTGSENTNVRSNSLLTESTLKWDQQGQLLANHFRGIWYRIRWVRRWMCNHGQRVKDLDPKDYPSSSRRPPHPPEAPRKSTGKGKYSTQSEEHRSWQEPSQSSQSPISPNKGDKGKAKWSEFKGISRIIKRERMGASISWRMGVATRLGISETISWRRTHESRAIVTFHPHAVV